MNNKEQELKKEDYSIPITQKDVINSKWVQEIKDKVITPCGDSIGYSLTGMWDLCSNVDSFVKEKVQEAKQDEIKRWNEFKKELRETDFLFRVEPDTLFTDKYVNAVELLIEERLQELKGK